MRMNTSLKIALFVTVLFSSDLIAQSQPASNLTSKVLRELRNYYGEGAEFDITVNESGAVIMSGTTSSFWDKRNMQIIVSRVPGVSAIRNELQVHTKAVADKTIKGNIESNLNDNAAILEPRKIQVEVDAGVVTLRGVVNFVREAGIAEDVASWQKGVKGISNKIQVLPPDVSMSDVNLQQLITGVVARFFPLEKDSIKAVVTGGRVTVTGTVNSLWTKKQVAKEVRRVRGVKGIENQLIVTQKGTGN